MTDNNDVLQAADRPVDSEVVTRCDVTDNERVELPHLSSIDFNIPLGAHRAEDFDLRPISECDCHEEKEGMSNAECTIREALLLAEVRRETTLNQLWMLPDRAEQEFQLNSVKKTHELFMTHPDPHPLLKEALELVELNTVRLLVRTARRFQIRIEQLNDQIARDSLPIFEFNGWKEEVDEDGKQYFINDEGLRRMDLPNEWWNEDVDRERRVDESHASVNNTEEFVASRVDNLLSEVNEEIKRCRKVDGDIEQELEKHEKSSDTYKDLLDARGFVAVVETISEKMLDFFYWAPLPSTPALPQVGMTNAYSQRRQRSRPNYQLELEEFFDDYDNLS